MSVVHFDNITDNITSTNRNIIVPSMMFVQEYKKIGKNIVLLNLSCRVLTQYKMFIAVFR